MKIICERLGNSDGFPRCSTVGSTYTWRSIVDWSIHRINMHPEEPQKGMLPAIALHAYAVFCIQWIVISHCAIIGKE